MDYHISTAQAWGIFVLAVWELFWKALAMWRAAKRGEKGWFVAILIINTVGVLPIAYLLLTNPKSDIKN